MKRGTGLFENGGKKVNRSHAAFNINVEPFYTVIIMDGLKCEVDGEHFWDAVAENAIFEFLLLMRTFTTKRQRMFLYMLIELFP
jgi:uncharacterized protein